MTEPVFPGQEVDWHNAEAAILPPMAVGERIILPADTFSDTLFGTVNEGLTTVIFVMTAGCMGLSATMNAMEARAFGERIIKRAEELEKVAAAAAETLLKGLRDDQG